MAPLPAGSTEREAARAPYRQSSGRSNRSTPSASTRVIFVG